MGLLHPLKEGESGGVEKSLTFSPNFYKSFLVKIQSLLEKKLREGLNPLLLEVVNESANHNVPEDSESHFRVLIVSERFNGLSLVQRHQMVHRLVAEQIKDKIHAFSQQTFTQKEFEDRGGRLPISSPPCAKKSLKS